MHIKAVFFSFKANEVFDSVYHCDSILLRILKGVLQILVLILKDHDWVIESTKNMLKCNFVTEKKEEENFHIIYYE